MNILILANDIIVEVLEGVRLNKRSLPHPSNIPYYLHENLNVSKFFNCAVAPLYHSCRRRAIPPHIRKEPYSWVVYASPWYS